MKICLYTHTALPRIGGQETVVDSLARQYTRLGHSVRVVAPSDGRHGASADRQLPYAAIRHPRFISTRRFLGLYIGWLRSYVRRHRFDVVHCHGVYPAGFVAARALKHSRIPLVLTSHGSGVYPADPRLSNPRLRPRHIEAIESATALVSISSFTRGGLQSLSGSLPPIVDIPNGVDVASFADSPPRPAQFDVSIAPGSYLLFLGRLVYRKGVDILLEAFASLPTHKPAELVVAGDGPERAALQRLAQGQGLHGRVRFMGVQQGEARHWLLSNSACLITPSRGWESFGLVVLESFASGRPVIASGMPGLADLIVPDKNGWLFAPESAHELAKHLKHVLAFPQRADRCGQQARRVAQAHDWSEIAQRHLRLYEGLARGETRTPHLAGVNSDAFHRAAKPGFVSKPRTV